MVASPTGRCSVRAKQDFERLGVHDFHLTAMFGKTGDEQRATAGGWIAGGVTWQFLFL